MKRRIIHSNIFCELLPDAGRQAFHTMGKGGSQQSACGYLHFPPQLPLLA